MNSLYFFFLCLLSSRCSMRIVSLFRFFPNVNRNGVPHSRRRETGVFSKFFFGVAFLCAKFLRTFSRILCGQLLSTFYPVFGRCSEQRIHLEDFMKCFFRVFHVTRRPRAVEELNTPLIGGRDAYGWCVNRCALGADVEQSGGCRHSEKLSQTMQSTQQFDACNGHDGAAGECVCAVRVSLPLY